MFIFVSKCRLAELFLPAAYQMTSIYVIFATDSDLAQEKSISTLMTVALLLIFTIGTVTNPCQ